MTLLAFYLKRSDLDSVASSGPAVLYVRPCYWVVRNHQAAPGPQTLTGFVAVPRIDTTGYVIPGKDAWGTLGVKQPQLVQPFLPFC
jgi:hypothetical protein